MRLSQRVQSLPPYLFAEIDRKKAIKQARYMAILPFVAEE